MKKDVRRIYAISDIHVTFPENVKLLGKICKENDFSQDTLIIAGDISERLKDWPKIFDIFTPSFKNVFFANGNHDLWVSDYEERREYEKKNKKKKYNSYRKLEEIKKLCEEKNVYYKPKRIYCSQIWVFPMLAWYDFELDSIKISDEEKLKVMRGWGDFHHCIWKNEEKLPTKTVDILDYFLSLNEIPDKMKKDDFVISASHFLPHPGLLPSKNVLIHGNTLYKVSGSVKIEKFLKEKINSKIHIAGHTHINYDTKINGIRHIQNALGYPGEKRANFKRESVLSTPICTLNVKTGKITENSLSYVSELTLLKTASPFVSTYKKIFSKKK